MERPLLDMDAPCEPPAVIVATLTRVHDDEKFIQRKLRTRRFGHFGRDGFFGAVPFNVGFSRRQHVWIVFKPHESFTKLALIRLDKLWADHLLNMNYLKESVQLRTLQLPGPLCGGFAGWLFERMGDWRGACGTCKPSSPPQL